MAGHSVFRHADTEADLFSFAEVNYKCSTANVCPQLKLNVITTTAEVRSVAPAIANTDSLAASLPFSKILSSLFV